MTRSNAAQLVRQAAGCLKKAHDCDDLTPDEGRRLANAWIYARILLDTLEISGYVKEPAPDPANEKA